MKKTILLIILLICILNSELHSAGPFKKKRHWYGFGFIYTSPMREVRFGKYHERGFDGNIYYRQVLRENFEIGIAAEYGFYTFSEQRFRKDKSVQDPAPGEPYLLDYTANSGTMFSIYSSLYMNALPKYDKEIFYSVGLGYYKLYNPRIDWRLNPFGPFDPDGNPYPDGGWKEWNATEELSENAVGFNIGLNYDRRIYKEYKLIFEVRFHQLMFSQELQQFLKFKFGFLF